MPLLSVVPVYNSLQNVGFYGIMKNGYRLYMWFIYALLSAIAASLVAIFGKLGLKGIDTTLATTVRSVIMAGFLVIVSFFLRKFDGFSLSSFSAKDWMWIALSGVAGALSWLFYFFALQQGKASQVVAIDRLSIVFVVMLAILFLGEKLSYYSVAGALLMALGAIFITLK